MKRAVAAVTSLTIIALTFAAGCGPSGPSTRAEVCSAFTTLGAQAMQGNGVFGNPLFTKAGDLADVAGRFPGSPNLASDSSALHAIADSDSTSELALMNATQHIAALCGQGLGIGSLFGDTGGDGVTGSGTYGTASAPTASEPTSRRRRRRPAHRAACPKWTTSRSPDRVG